MSGDVQPRRRKDKKKKKDELGVEEPRGTAAIFGEGDVFMHSQHDHGTGGHWCAKIIFFSLLAVLVTLIGLIILENRGLSEFDASVVESQYSGYLEGWLEDAPEDEHHDDHTFELKHHIDDDHDEDDELEYEVKKIEKEPSDEEPISNELPTLPEDDDSVTFVEEHENLELEKDEDEFLDSDNDDDEPPVIESITAPIEKPLEEVEDDMSSEKPPDTLKEEEEYEKRQEELRREEEQASHMWLKLAVGGALLVATHAVMRRANVSRDVPESDDRSSRDETPSVIDRRMTLIPEEESVSVTSQKTPEMTQPQLSQEVKSKIPLIVKSASTKNQECQNEPVDTLFEVQTSQTQDTKEKELYSDDEEAEEEEEIVEPPRKETLKQAVPAQQSNMPESPEEEEVPDDVEIIDDEQLEEELEDEEDAEEEISDVDDAELLSRLEAKYGRLPEPERPGQKNKDGGNSVEDDWFDEPSDPQWRQHLNQAEEELRRFQDWLEN